MIYDNNIVSVVIPIYNAEKYIEQTVLSVLSQTYSDIELVLVDDCSKDNSFDIICSLAKEHKNIVFHRQETNMGAAVARNTALKLANGRYIAFLDGDDLWDEDKLEKQIPVLKEKNASISYTAIDMIDENGTQIKGKRRILSKVTYKTLLKNTMIATSTVLIDRNKTGEFEMPLIRSGQDYATWLFLLRNGGSAVGVDKVLTHYRVHEGSLSSQKTKNYIDVYRIQTEYEGIGKVSAAFNTICYCINAVKKYYL